jgi:plastocyanin
MSGGRQGGHQVVIKVSLAALVALGVTVLPTWAATVQITMENMVISPAETSAKVGDTLELINKDALVHSATARNGDFDVTMPPKKTVTMVLKKPGTIDYYCRFHPNMKAVLTVAP